MKLSIKENILFPFSDPRWMVKVLICAVCWLTLIPFPAVIGYMLRITREAAQGEDEKLPEFGQWGKLWIHGFICCLCLYLVTLLSFVPLVGIGFVSAVTYHDESIILILFLVCYPLLLWILGRLLPALMLRYAMTQQATSLFGLRNAWNDLKIAPKDSAWFFLFPFLSTVLLSLLSVSGVGVILAIPGSILTMFILGRILGSYYRVHFQ